MQVVIAFLVVFLNWNFFFIYLEDKNFGDQNVIFQISNFKNFQIYWWIEIVRNAKDFPHNCNLKVTFHICHVFLIYVKIAVKTNIDSPLLFICWRLTTFIETYLYKKKEQNAWIKREVLFRPIVDFPVAFIYILLFFIDLLPYFTFIFIYRLTS